MLSTPSPSITRAKKRRVDENEPPLPSPRTLLFDQVRAAVELYRESPHTAENQELILDTILHAASLCDASMDDVRDLLSAERLAVSFSNVTFAAIVPLMHMDEVRPLRSQLASFRVYRAHMPDSHHRRIHSWLEFKSEIYLGFDQHANERARDNWLEPLWMQAVVLFRRQAHDAPEQPVAGSVTNDGRINHVVHALQSVIFVFFEIKFAFPTADVQYRKVLAQILAECDGRVAENVRLGHSADIPVFGMLTDGRTFEFFEYTASERLAGRCPLKIGTLSWDQRQRTRLAISPELDQGTEEYAAAYRNVEGAIFYVMLMGFRLAMAGYAARPRLTHQEREAFRDIGPALEKTMDSFLGAAEVFDQGDGATADRMAARAIESLDAALQLLPQSFRVDNPAFFQ